VLSNETPVSIAIRRFFAAHPEATGAVFGESRLPTLVQYDPLVASSRPTKERWW
jgi:phenylacetate-CoA ligase